MIPLIKCLDGNLEAIERASLSGLDRGDRQRMLAGA